MVESNLGNDHGDHIEPAGPEIIRVVPKGSQAQSLPSTSTSSDAGGHGAVEFLGGDMNVTGGEEEEKKGWMANFRGKRKGWDSYVKTKEFWFVLALGQVLALCITGTSTLSALLAKAGNNIPAFQNLFNYILLCLIYTPITVYNYGFKGWGRLVLKDGWKYFILGFIDVQGNYFTVLAYNYTTILSCTLIDFWAIAVVMIVSLVFLKVRYHITQYTGILVCIGGLGILLASDHITGYNQYAASDPLKGDLFALLGASFYGLSNVLQEFFVSKRPIYEVLGQIALYGMVINGVQAAIFNREQLQNAVWSPNAGGYFSGYTLILALFYSLAPIMFRMASAAFFNISLLTSDFWSVIVGVQGFHLHVHWMYPIAFVCILLGMLVYFITEGVMGDAEKPWLGANQDGGVNGVGTAKRRIDRKNASSSGANVV